MPEQKNTKIIQIVQCEKGRTLHWRDQNLSILQIMPNVWFRARTRRGGQSTAYFAFDSSKDKPKNDFLSIILIVIFFCRSFFILLFRTFNLGVNDGHGTQHALANIKHFKRKEAHTDVHTYTPFSEHDVSPAQSDVENVIFFSHLCSLESTDTGGKPRESLHLDAHHSRTRSTASLQQQQNHTQKMTERNERNKEESRTRRNSENKQRRQKTKRNLIILYLCIDIFFVSSLYLKLNAFVMLQNSTRTHSMLEHCRRGERERESSVSIWRAKSSDRLIGWFAWGFGYCFTRNDVGASEGRVQRSNIAFC